MRKRKLTDEQISEIRILYKNGVKIPVLAKQYDRHQTVIRHILHNEYYFNKDYRPAPKFNFPTKYALELLQDNPNLTYRDVGKKCAEKLGREKSYSKSSVYQHLRKLRGGN